MAIFWMEDDASIIWPLVELVEESHEVRPYRTVTEALDHVDALRKAEAIIVDMILPWGSGVRGTDRYPGLFLLATLRKKGINCPAVILSVVDRGPLEQRAADLGCFEFVRKPATQLELKEAVDSLLVKEIQGA